MRDVLGFPAVDAGHGWLIFALPPGELAAHPTDDHARHELYLMCDDIRATVAELGAKGVEFTQGINDAGFGLITSLRLPDGEELALYEPRHASPVSPAGGGRLPAAAIARGRSRGCGLRRLRLVGRRDSPAPARDRSVLCHVRAWMGVVEGQPRAPFGIAHDRRSELRVRGQVS